MAIAVYGRYTCSALMGEGGFGKVYRAWDALLEREVALKVIEIPDGEARDPYLVEPRLLSRLRHPHIVELHGIEMQEDGRRLLIDLEWMDGGTVGDLIRTRGGLGIADAVRVAGAILLALSHIHQAGVVHRDVRPANILLGRGGADIRLADFSEAEPLHALTPPDGALRAPVARRRRATPEPEVRLYATGVAGYYPYMAPECFDLRPRVDARVDLWAVGVTLYEMLAGHRPFVVPEERRESRLAWREAVTRPVPPVAAVRPETPGALSELVAHALTPDRDARVGSAREMLEALRAAAPGAGR